MNSATCKTPVVCRRVDCSRNCSCCAGGIERFHGRSNMAGCEATLCRNCRGSALSKRPFCVAFRCRPPEIVAKTVVEVSSRLNKLQHPIFVSYWKYRVNYIGYSPEIRWLEGGGCNVSQALCFQVFSFQWDTRGVLRPVETY